MDRNAATKVSLSRLAGEGWGEGIVPLGTCATVKDVLEASALPALEARVLLAHVLGVDRAWLAAHSEETLRGEQQQRIEALYARRRAGEPVAYITGEREFYGLMLAVTPAVLIPRPETELVVDVALEHLSDGERVLDLGTGSGAIAVAVAHQRHDVEVHAGDMSAEALGVATLNAARHGVSVRFERSDWLAAFAGERFNLIVANPPYIASADTHLAQGDLRYEPRHALEAGLSGMECLERIAIEARVHLVPGGWLIMEHGHDQGETCAQLLRTLGYERVSDRDDLAGLPRVVAGRVGAMAC